jgi:nickel transport protein
MTQSIKALTLAMLLSVMAIGAAQAHKVTIFAWAEGDRVFTQSKFSGGKRVNNGTVEVFDSRGDLLLTGQTDDQGEFSFVAPAVTDLNIVLTAGMGHQNSWHLSATELSGPSGKAVDAKIPPPVDADPVPVVEPHPGPAVPGLTPQAVEAIVAQQLEEKLRPLTRLMAAAQEKRPSMSDIFGGIGYILGLVGLGAYLRYRKDERSS